MKYYLMCVGVLLSLFELKSAHSMELDFEKIGQLLKACSKHPGLVDRMLQEAARIDEEDSLDEVNIIDHALQLVPITQQKCLDANGIITGIINEDTYKEDKVFSINFTSIDPSTTYANPIDSLVYWRENLYNLRSLTLSRFIGANDFVRAFFSNENNGRFRTSPPCFISLTNINLPVGEGLGIDGESLKSVLDHFARYDEVVRDMVQYAVKDGKTVASIHIKGVSEDLLAQTDLSNYSVYKARTVTLKNNVKILYRSGQPGLEVEFIAHLKI